MSLLSMKLFIFLCIGAFAVNNSNAQIGIGIAAPDSSAVLHIQDTTRGLLIPRMTMLQRSIIHHPAEGLMVYQTDSIKGFWYFSNGQWRNMLSINSGGKQTIVLSGPITNEEAQAKIASEWGVNTQEIRIAWCSKLTAIDLSVITSATEITITSNPVLQTINLNNLVAVEGSFSVTDCPVIKDIGIASLERLSQVSTSKQVFFISGGNIKSLFFPALKELFGALTIEKNDSLQSISFPLLEKHTGILTGNGLNSIDISGANLSSLSFPLLTEAGFLFIRGSVSLSASFPVLTTIESGYFTSSLSPLSFPALTTVNGSFQLINNSLATSFSLPLLQTVKNLTIADNANLTNFSAPALTSSSEIQFNGNNGLATISFASLITSGNLTLRGSALASVAFPVLKNAADFTISQASNSFTNLNLPALLSVHNLSISGAPSISTVSLPSLATAGILDFTSRTLANYSSPALVSAKKLRFGTQNYPVVNTALLSLSFPALTSLTEDSTSFNPVSTIENCVNLTSIDISNLTSFKNISFIFSNNKLPASQINNLLSKFVSITPPLINKTISLNQSVSAPPSGQGIIDKATLIARGNFVSTD